MNFCSLSLSLSPHLSTFLLATLTHCVTSHRAASPRHTRLSKPNQLVPPHIRNRDPSYFIVSGLVFTAVSEPYLMSEYGPEYGTSSPVRLLDR